MVPTGDECKKAAKQLNLTYKWPLNPRTDRPAGCFKTSNNGLIYFNSEINPANTNTTTYQHFLTAEGIRKYAPICYGNEHKWQ